VRRCTCAAPTSCRPTSRRMSSRTASGECASRRSLAGPAATCARRWPRCAPSNVTGIVLDLRGNPGGLLDEGVQAASAFLDGGTVVSYRGRGVESKTYAVSGHGDTSRRSSCWSTRAPRARPRSSPARCRTATAPSSSACGRTAKGSVAAAARTVGRLRARGHRRALLHAVGTLRRRGRHHAGRRGAGDVRRGRDAAARRRGALRHVAASRHREADRVPKEQGRKLNRPEQEGPARTTRSRTCSGRLVLTGTR